MSKVRLLLRILILGASILTFDNFTAEAKPAVPFHLSPDGRQAYQVLLNCHRFAGAAVGPRGRPSGYVIALRSLLKEPAAGRAFKTLLREATLPGQLYALCGLYFTDQRYFRSVVGKYREREETVETQFGCFVGRARVSDLVERRGPNTVKLEHPNQSVEGWARVRDLWKCDCDIIGGGYPSMFKGKLARRARAYRGMKLTRPLLNPSS